MTAAVPSPSSGRWLFGPAVDLLLGCGALYILVFVAFLFEGPSWIAGWPTYLTPILVIFFSMPHYGGTLVRVYDQAKDRRSYAVFSVWITLLVFGAFAVGVHSPMIGALMFTVYLTWSPWHYTGQNYGLSVMFLRRRGVEITPLAKRLLYASFILSYAVAFLVMHAPQRYVQFDPLSYSANAIYFLPLGIPNDFRHVVVPVLLTLYAASLIGAAVLLLRSGRPRDLVPTAVLAFTQSLWFTIPMTIESYGAKTGIHPFDGYLAYRPYYFLIALGHGIQYLWVTTYYARVSGNWGGYSLYMGKIFASGVAIWTIPSILFAPHALGSLSADAGLTILIASAVNIHHFILDGAIWKLRHSRIASVLIRSQKEGDGPEPIGPPRTSWARRLVWATASLAAVAALYDYWDRELRMRPALARGDYETAGTALDRVVWLGKDSARDRANLARLAARAGDLEVARRHAERSAELTPSVPAWRQVAELRARQGDIEGTVAAYEEALALGGDDPELLRSAADWLINAGAAQEAQQFMQRAVRTAPDDAGLQAWAAFAYYRDGDETSAVQHLREAYRLDPTLRGAAINLAWILATSRDAAIRDPDEAIRLASEAIERSQPDVGLLDTLAAAYASAGRFDEAVEAAKRAVELARSDGNEARGAEIRERIALYRTGQPYLGADPGT